jgi:hypothetical protein
VGTRGGDLQRLRHRLLHGLAGEEHRSMASICAADKLDKLASVRLRSFVASSR